MTITTKKLTLTITIATILIAMTLILGTIGLGTNQAFAADNGIVGNVFGIQATSGTAKIQEYDPITHLKVSEFSTPATCNGRGLAFDGQDLWYTCVGFGGVSFGGEGIIHKIATTGGADITTIPDPYGFGARGVGAMDIHSATGNLWITSYLPINSQQEISEIDLNTGNVLASCNIPFGGGGAGSETLVVDETAGTFLSNGGEANLPFIDEYTLPAAVNQGNCALVANFSPTPVIGGVDFDGAGNLVEGSFNSIVNLGVRPFNANIGSFSTEVFFEDITFLTEVGPTQKVCESDRERICKEVATNDADGDGQIEVGELITFDMTIKLTNPAPVDWVDTIVKDRFGAEIEVVGKCTASQGIVDISTKGKSKKVFLEWDVGTVPANGGMATLTCTLQTDMNPAGMQEYSSPGEYDFNSGVNLKFNAGEDGKQVSFETPSIEVTVTEAD